MKIDFIKLASQYGIKFLASLSGFWAWLANFALNILWGYLKKLAVRVYTYFKTKNENERKLKEYEEAINKPDATSEEIKKEGKDFLQS